MAADHAAQPAARAARTALAAARRLAARHALTLAMAAVMLAAASPQLLGGMRDVGTIEEWGIYHLFDTQGVVWWTYTSDALRPHSIRPFTVVPHGVGYLLTADSFVGLQVVQTVCLALQAAAMTWLLRTLGAGLPLAGAGGILFALYPALDQAFVTRSVHIHWTSACVVGAAALLMWMTRDRVTPLRAAAMMGAQAVGLMTYEAHYSVVVFVPLLLWAVAAGGTGRRIRLGLLWFVVPVLNGIRILLFMASGTPVYQEGIAQEQGRSIQEFVDLAGRVFRGMAAVVRPPYGWGVGAVALAVVVLGVAVVILGRDARATASWRTMAITGVVAALIAPVCALVYAAQPVHLLDPLRIFAVASIPATVATVALLAAVSRRVPSLELPLAVLLVVGVALGAQSQRSYWHERTQAIEHTLGAVSIASAADGDDRPIVVVDEAQVTGRDGFTLPGLLLGSGLSYLGDRAPVAAMCLAGQTEPIPPYLPGIPPCVATPQGTRMDGAPPEPDAHVFVLRRSSRPSRPSPEILARLTSRQRNVLRCIGVDGCAAGPHGLVAVPEPAP